MLRRSPASTISSVEHCGRAPMYPNMVRVMLIHSGPVILPELEESLGVYAQGILAGRKVEIRLKPKVEGFSGGAVRLTDATMISTNTLVWTAERPRIRCSKRFRARRKAGAFW